MKIFFSPASPFVRKCMVIAHELGLADRIERLPSAAGPVARDQTIIPSNPLGQVPTFITDDGQALFEGLAQAQSRNNALPALVPNLVEAMFTGFPGNSGETVRITVAPERDGY